MHPPAIGHGYSLWLIPDPEKPLSNRLNEVITTLAAVHDTPVFPAHVTLINDIPLDEAAMTYRSRGLGQAFPPFRIDFREFGSNGTYFQILFAVAEYQLCLWSANERARKVFGVEQPPYSPHMSFAYGDMDLNEVNELTQQLQDQLVLPLRVEFPILELWNTTGPIDAWQRVHGLRLR